MYATILDSFTLTTKDIIEYELYFFAHDIDYEGKSWIRSAKKPNVAENDFLLCWDEDKIVFKGICESFNSDSDNYDYTVNLKEIEALFDRKIIPDEEDEALIASTGIEDFITMTIFKNWVDSDDPRVDMPRIGVGNTTSTKVKAKISSICDLQNGTFNLKTFLGNAKERYGIYLEWTFSLGSLAVTIMHKSESSIPVDIETSDISSYKETYDINALAKLNVKWVIPEQVSGDDILRLETYTMRTFYLLTNRTISEDKDAANRAAGTVSSTVIETEYEDEMIQQVQDEFKQNSYKHQVTFDLNKYTKLYDLDDLYVGRSVTMKTKTGIQSTLITARSESSDSACVSFTFGNLKITLIEKLRRLQ